MRSSQKYGRSPDLPAFESFRYRAGDLGSFLRLCDYCLRNRRRCCDSRRRWWSDHNWKSFRRMRYVPV